MRASAFTQKLLCIGNSWITTQYRKLKSGPAARRQHTRQRCIEQARTQMSDIGGGRMRTWSGGKDVCISMRYRDMSQSTHTRAFARIARIRRRTRSAGSFVGNILANKTLPKDLCSNVKLVAVASDFDDDDVYRRTHVTRARARAKAHTKVCKVY